MYFANSNHLERLIDAYFESIKGEFHFEDVPTKNKNDDVTEQRKVWDRPMEPPTVSGLALYLGFDSCEALGLYCADGHYASPIKRAGLRIETAYEQKLHNGPASGAIFALKKLGWNQKETNTTGNSTTPVNVHIAPSDIPIARSEKDVLTQVN